MSVDINAQWLTAHQLLLHLSWLELTSCFWISADACPQFCLLPLPLHRHCSAGCAQHRSQTGPLKTCQTMLLLCSKPCYGSAFLSEEGPTVLTILQAHHVLQASCYLSELVFSLPLSFRSSLTGLLAVP